MEKIKSAKFQVTFDCPVCKETHTVVFSRESDMSLDVSACECCGTYVDITIDVHCPKCKTFLEVVFK